MAERGSLLVFSGQMFIKHLWPEAERGDQRHRGVGLNSRCSLERCVILGMLLDLSEPEFFQLQKGLIIPTLQGLLI